jgi:hypothetical protein
MQQDLFLYEQHLDQEKDAEQILVDLDVVQLETLWSFIQQHYDDKHGKRELMRQHAYTIKEIGYELVQIGKAYESV